MAEAARPDIPQRVPTPDFRDGLQKVDKEIVRILRDREKDARILMKRNHGIILGLPDYKSYHGEDPGFPEDENIETAKGEGHVNKVADRIVGILQTYFDAEGPVADDDPRAIEREEMLVFGHYIGQIHDLVQKYEFAEVVNGVETKFDPTEGNWKDRIGKGKKIIRKRKVEDNENETINDEIKFMDEANEQRRQLGETDLFTEKHKEWVRRALTVTIPTFNTIIFEVQQQKLMPNDTILTHATAWADLKGGIFMDGWEQFIKEGDLNLLEDNPDILEVVMNPDQYDEDFKKEIGDRIRVGRVNQISFAETQWNQLEQQIIRFPNAADRLRRDHFKVERYNETLQKVKDRAEEGKTQNYSELFIPLRERVLEERKKYPQPA